MVCKGCGTIHVLLPEGATFDCPLCAANRERDEALSRAEVAEVGWEREVLRKAAIYQAAFDLWRRPNEERGSCFMGWMDGYVAEFAAKQPEAPSAAPQAPVTRAEVKGLIAAAEVTHDAVVEAIAREVVVKALEGFVEHLRKRGHTTTYFVDSMTHAVKRLRGQAEGVSDGE